MRRSTLVVFMPALLAGCTMIPHYHRPAAPVPATWPSGPAYNRAQATTSTSQPQMAQTGWQGFFKSPELRGLIAKALANNRDLRQTTLNIQIARDQYRIQRAALFPTIDANLTFSRIHTPGSLVTTGTTGTAASSGGASATSIGGGGGSSGGHSYTTTEYQANLGVTNYELDLFGRVRSLTRASFEDYLASQSGRDAAQVSLVAEVANAYLTLLADRAQLKLADDTVTAFQDTLKLTQARLDNGVGTDLDVAQAQTAVQTAAVNRIAYTRQTAQDLNALSLLVGLPVGADDVKTDFKDADAFAGDLPAGLPSDLLQNRPDIRQAEHLLLEQNANLGAARAAFFPQVSLTGTGGFSARTLHGLFDSGTGAWSFLPTLSLPIFTGGANDAGLDLVKTEKNVYIAQYEGTIQTAFREVADALAARGTLGDELTAQQALADAANRSYTLATARYNTGIDSYLNVLESQRDLFSADQGLLGQKLALLANRVTLYQTLGGGLDAPLAVVNDSP